MTVFACFHHVCRVCCAFQHARNAHGWSVCQTTEKSAATWLPSCPRPSNLHKYPLTGGSEKSCLESGRAREKATASFSTLKCRQAHEEDGVRTIERVSLQSRMLSMPPCPMVMQTMLSQGLSLASCSASPMAYAQGYWLTTVCMVSCFLLQRAYG